MLANEGVWMPLLNSRFLIASVESKRFKQAIIDLNGAEISSDKLISIMSETILLGWSDVKTPSGENLQYTPEMVIVALKSNESVKLFVDKISTSIGLYCEQS